MRPIRCRIAVLAFVATLSPLAAQPPDPPNPVDDPFAPRPFADVAQVPKGLERKSLEQKIDLELAFLRRVVKLTREQEIKLSMIGLKSLQKDRINERRVAPGIDFRRQNVEAEAPEADALALRQFERALKKAIDDILDEEQKAVYKRESAERNAFARSVKIDALILVLDSKLDLSPFQIEVIRSKLADGSDMDGLDVDYYLFNQGFPALPDELIVPFLEPYQQALFKQWPRPAIRSWSHPFFPGSIDIDR